MPAADSPDGARIVERVVLSVTRFASRVAVDGPGGGTYGELGRCIDATARELRAAGVEPADVLALSMTRDASTPVRLLGAWATGACVALIDSRLPELVRAAQVAACGADWLVEAPGAGPAAPKRLQPDATLQAAASRCAHVLFTSGTTGGPAAIGVRAEALLAGLDWYLETFTPGPRDRVAWFSGLGHDPVLRDILVPLMSGGTLVVPPAGALAAPLGLAAALRESRCSILHCTPALAELIAAGADAVTLPDLRLIVSGGAGLAATTATALRALAPAATLVNAYGATETPQIVACAVIRPGRPPAFLASGSECTVPIGRGVGGCDVELDGPDGEIVVRGRRLSEGLLGGPGLEVDRGGPEGELRVFRTGDLGRESASGLLVTGRRDRQMSVNGLRISPEEVEHAARSHPQVLDARAALRLGPAGDLVELSVVHRAGQVLGVAELRGYLRERLRPGAVPARILVTGTHELDHNHKYAVASPPSNVSEDLDVDP